ncbi:MAG: FecR family protein, partial [Alphaproteobacteria bacterium]|nr:FecR family protein [Alphaproteobacteria bacterium]
MLNDSTSGIEKNLTLQIDAGQSVLLPHNDFVTSARFVQEGPDLHLILPDGQSVIVANYFFTAKPPLLITETGLELTPSLVDSFLSSPNLVQYAQSDGTVAQAPTPIGNLEFMGGEVFAVRTDGTRVQLALGDPVYQGDQIETSKEGSVKIRFIDDTIFTLGEDARLALDELVFDPASASGTSSFSILKGSFVFVSGQIAKNDYDNMQVSTPVATIGIRGTTVTGTVLIGDVAFSFSVLEGSITISAGGETISLTESFGTAIGNLDGTGRIALAQITTTQSDVIRGSSQAIKALGEADLRKLEQTIEREIENQTGEKVDLDLGNMIAVAEEAQAQAEAEAAAEEANDGQNPPGTPTSEEAPPPDGEEPAPTGEELPPEEALEELPEEPPEELPEELSEEIPEDALGEEDLIEEVPPEEVFQENPDAPLDNQEPQQDDPLDNPDDALINILNEPDSFSTGSL